MAATYENPLKSLILTIENESEFLEQVSEPVTSLMIADGRALAIIKQMAAVVDGVGIGLAAVQIGYHYRIVMADIGNGIQAFVNPEIVDVSDEQVAVQEGCLSVPDKQYMVTRHKQVTMVHTKLDGSTETLKLEPFGSIVMQHEIDHLDGITINRRGVPIITTNL